MKDSFDEAAVRSPDSPMGRTVFLVAAAITAVLAYRAYHAPAGERTATSGAFAIGLGVTMWTIVLRALLDGHVRKRRVNRSDAPVSFWTIVGLYFIVGLALVAAGLSVLS